jgi:hypothetical protein
MYNPSRLPIIFVLRLDYSPSASRIDFAATVYHVWQERNARIFARMSRTSNLVFNQIECIIRDKFNLMRNVLPTNENKRIQRAWRVNNIDS